MRLVEGNETSYFSRMSKFIYITNTSLDGCVEDETGAFDWVIPDQVHALITELLRPIGTHLYGRRLHETMAYWDGPVEGYPPEHRDFARIWQKAEKIVFSRALTGATTRNTRVERDFDSSPAGPSLGYLFDGAVGRGPRIVAGRNPKPR
jgi:hypothetical protein